MSRNITFTIILCLLMSFWLYTHTNNNKLNRIITREWYYKFKNFEETLEGINKDISYILLSDDRDDSMILNNIHLLRQNVFQFYLANDNVFDIPNKKVKDEYIHKLFLDIDDIFEDIIKDSEIDNNEKDYLKTLFSYNEKLISIFNSLVDKNTLSSDFKIEWILNFSKEADKLLAEDNYSILSRYYEKHGNSSFNLENPDIENTEAKRIYNKTVKILKENAILIPENESGNILDQDKLNSDKDYYQVNYNKENGTISIYPDGVKYTDKKTEAEIDEIERNIANQINVFNYEMVSRKVNKTEGKLSGIGYKYIKKVNDIYDETNMFRLRINEGGKLDDFYLCSTKSFAELPKTRLSPDSIISKLNLNYPVEKYTLTRKKDGYMEYKFHIKINNAMYVLVVDGETGKKKYFDKLNK